MTNVTSADAGSNLYPVLPLRDIVVFPHMIVPLLVGREKSIRALEDVMGSDRQIMLVTQINAGDDDPAPEAIYKVGTVANVLQLLKLPDGTVKVLVEGKARARIASDLYYIQNFSFWLDMRIIFGTIISELRGGKGF